MKLMLKKEEAHANKNEDDRLSAINSWVTTLAHYKWRYYTYHLQMH